MNFSDPFQTFTLRLLSYLVVSIVNHMIIFLSFTFPISINVFLWLWRVASSKFSENYYKETGQWGLYFLMTQVWGADTFFGNFLDFPEHIISREQLLLNFLIFFLCIFQLFIFLVWSHLLVICSLWKTFINFKILLWICQFYGTNFLEFCEFWSIWRKSIPKRFSFQDSFATLDTNKKKFLIHLRQLIIG